MESQTLGELFVDLRKATFDLAEKESRHENLLDILEIVAVAAGKKPAHLNGQGFRSEDLLRELERIARKHRLPYRRTHGLKARWSREPNFHPAIVEWKRMDERTHALQSADVLWIYKDDNEETSRLIDAVSSGELDITRALGYPACCVTDEAEFTVRLRERYVDALVATFGPLTPDEIIEHHKKDTGVTSVAIDELSEKRRQVLDRTREKYPFVSFTACLSCLASDTSPAAMINREMRELAYELSAAYAHEIEDTSGELRRLRGHHEGRVLHYQGKAGRNEPCPCGSGKKYKKCHGGPKVLG